MILTRKEIAEIAGLAAEQLKALVKIASMSQHTISAPSEKARWAEIGEVAASRLKEKTP